MTVPFLISLDFKKTSTWTSDDRQSSQIYRNGTATIDDLSMRHIGRKNFFMRCLSKQKVLNKDIELRELIVAAYNEKNKEIGNIFVVIENLIKQDTENNDINSINATGIFERLNDIRNGKYLSTNQILLFF